MSPRPIALITGSSRGIGFGIARGLIAAGYDVVLNGRTENQLRSGKQQLEEIGGTAHVATFDVADADAVQAAVENIESGVGPIEALVNSAGVVTRTPLIDLSLEQWNRTLEVNLSGCFVVSTCVARGMIVRGRGKIVNIGSVQSALSRGGLGAYAASKGALASLTRTMCVEWAGHNIQVNALSPGYVLTDMNAEIRRDETLDAWVVGRTPAARWGTVADVVGPAVWLCSEQAAFVNGQTIYVDGGITAAI
ncbi:gluconate 5-dehydrogenase [Mycolicibacterium wolinskyi]|uniref:Gluconate 5-dehydrogenase n=1 Tax=Mycolicibacterium wolinskyi TaxID=59750 RepID=A0A132PD42_9MYCO|nr:SDR family oxidoreductase [Mycolicibacterium wolinskyi]KWX20137.1 gluconate 5-dehydrogenase [Mycolicibacterium wolinskyi]